MSPFFIPYFFLKKIGVALLVLPYTDSFFFLTDSFQTVASVVQIN